METADVAGLKFIINILDNPLTLKLLALSRWMADYYLHPLGLTIEAVVPKAVGRTKPKKKKFVHLVPAYGLEWRASEGEKTDCFAHHAWETGRDGARRVNGIFNCNYQITVTIRSYRSCRTGITCRSTERIPPTLPPELMPEQEDAVGKIQEAVSHESFAVFLLHGVTGSGKTEVYLRAIASLAKTGKGTIVLVPEIALTPQLLNRFRGRFGDRVAVLHSGLTERERSDEYRRIQSGHVDVAIGARSAVFAPFAKAGLIIVDEEHENSYKQDEGLRYHARDVAVMRAKLGNAIAVLGSATPSLESFYNAKSGKYRYLRLANRVDHRPMPEVRIIDIKTLPKNNLYSPRLIEVYQDTA